MNSDYNYQSLNSWCVFDCHRIIITMITTITTFYILLRLWEELPQQNSAPLKSTGIASSTQLCHQYRSNIAIKLRCSIVPSHPLSNWSGRVGGWDFVDIKFKSGGGPYKITNRGQIRPCILYKIPASNPICFSPFFLLYQVSGSTKSGRILTNWQCLTPACWHGYMSRRTIFGFCRGRRVCPTETMRNYGEKQTTKRNNRFH